MFSFFTLYHLCAMCLTPSRLTLFPSTTLFRSKARLAAHPQVEEIPQAGAVVVAHFLLGIVAGATLGEDQPPPLGRRSEEHTSELQSRGHLVCRLLLEKKKTKQPDDVSTNVTEV